MAQPGVPAKPAFGWYRAWVQDGIVPGGQCFGNASVQDRDDFDLRAERCSCGQDKMRGCFDSAVRSLPVKPNPGLPRRVDEGTAPLLRREKGGLLFWCGTAALGCRPRLCASIVLPARREENSIMNRAIPPAPDIIWSLILNYKTLSIPSLMRAVQDGLGMRLCERQQSAR